ncbi:arylsulfatase [Bacteroidia bacterium]|nr:arylsulfatase [Bacteroidia bacterium]
MNKITTNQGLRVAFCALLPTVAAAAPERSLKSANKDPRPNIIVILADDLGYSDPGCYGGEIETPNLDALARGGIRFNSFFNAGRSCPTRASLLTGLYQHQAGIGRMTFDEHLPGYRGTLSHNAVTIAEVLRQAGYNTGMVGKWHVAETPLLPHEEQRQWLAHQLYRPLFAPPENYPTQRGFDDFYGIIYGVADYFDPFSLVEGETPVQQVPKGYYITRALSDKAVSYVDRYAKGDKPFFLYLSYTAPHWPLHALPEDIARYENSYKAGWEAVRNARYERIRKLGIFPGADNFLSQRQFNDSWDDNPTSEWDARAMAVHAAMVYRMDQGIGELTEALRRNGQLDRTLILFLSDNGCSNENCQDYSPGDNDRPDMTRDGEPIVYPRKKEAMPGPETVFASIGARWANVANTPFRFWKAKSFNGGICTPMIAHWPDGISKKMRGRVTSQMGHVMDIMATCVDLAGADYPEVYAGNAIIPLEGRSLAPVFATGVRRGHDCLGFEHFRQSAFITRDGWKIVRQGGDARWELYDLKNDPSEMHDMAAAQPERVASMTALYGQWADKTLVEPSPGRK